MGVLSIFLGMMLVVICIIFGAVGEMSSSMAVMGVIIGIILFAFPIIKFFINSIKEENEKNRIKEQNNIGKDDKIREIQKKYLDRITDDYKKGAVDSDYLYFHGHLYIDNQKLIIVEKPYTTYETTAEVPTKLTINEYDLNTIKYFKCEGSIEKQQYISGGGGGGSSLKGAIVGGLIAGDVGAIIGSRQKVDEIKTSYSSYDDRHIDIISNNGNEVIWKASINCYEYLLEQIPEKDYENYISNLKNKGKK